jgi:hypothetical protein
MTIADTLAGDARVRCFDGDGTETTEPLAIRRVEIPTADGAGRKLWVAPTL